MSNVEKKYFSPEFKREAVRQLDEGDKQASQLARELGVRRNQLYKWKTAIETYGEHAFPGNGNRPLNAPKDDSAALRAEIKRLQEENDILKKAAKFFASTSN